MTTAIDKAVIYIVDDDADVRESLQWLLESIGLTVVGCDSAQQFFDCYPAQQSGCILMDVRMPGLSGLAAQKQLKQRNINLPVIFLSAHGDVDIAVTAMTQGAMTFIEKPFNDQLLLDHVQNALTKDQQRCSQEQQAQQFQQRYLQLTKREKQVFSEVIQGKTNNEIAESLSINRKTVEGHRANMMGKMQAQSLAELIQIAVSLNLLPNLTEQR